jgi:mevalonate kinase
MAYSMFKASAPGSLMLLGEYAVLYGKKALVAAIDKRMTVTLVPRNDQKICIYSALGEHETTVRLLKIKDPFHYVLSVLLHYKPQLTIGCDITIESEFSDTVGFGSSAAVTVAMLAVVNAWLSIKFKPNDMILAAQKIIQSVQGQGSGADAAASVLGGVVLFSMSPLSAKKIADTLPIAVIYSGLKTPTGVAIATNRKAYVRYKNIYSAIFSAIDASVIQATKAIKDSDLVLLGEIFSIHQGLHMALGVSTPILTQLVLLLQSYQTVHGAKISGSGLGDCVIALGEARPEEMLHKLSHIAHGSSYMPVTIQKRGLCLEKN